MGESGNIRDKTDIKRIHISIGCAHHRCYATEHNAFMSPSFIAINEHRMRREESDRMPTRPEAPVATVG